MAACLGWTLAGVAIQTASAQVFTVSAPIDSPVAIPDNSAVGTVQSLYVDGLTGVVKTLQVQLNIQSHPGGLMYNGDLYLTLLHNGTSTVLLNRVGRRDGFSAGYPDGGFNITLSDSAAADIHSYRVTLNGNDFTPISLGETPGALTGTWQPDGRAVDPESVLTTSLRTTSLSLFSGASPNGTWSLFLSDLSPGASADLVSWSLSITVVPEPRDVALLTGASLLALGLWRRARRTASRSC
jgi:subtilisin-like proprotein convertase family protein